MSRKDYVLLANALMSATPLAQDGEKAMQTWNTTVRKMAQALQADNPRFDFNRFVAAARGEG